MEPELAALVVHDLKNALVTLEAELGALRLAPDTRLAVQAHARCAAMRQRFMTFLTLYGSDGRLQAHCADESPQAFLGGIVKSMRGNALKTTLAKAPAAPAFWYFDFRLVHMALDAALNNALRFARSRVVLGAREEDGHLVFSVDDDGPGLGTGDPCHSSTGLGTELCRAVANAHATAQRVGGVRLFNRSEGGARFELWLA